MTTRSSSPESAKNHYAEWRQHERGGKLQWTIRLKLSRGPFLIPDRLGISHAASAMQSAYSQHAMGSLWAVYGQFMGSLWASYGHVMGMQLSILRIYTFYMG